MVGVRLRIRPQLADTPLSDPQPFPSVAKHVEVKAVFFEEIHDLLCRNLDQACRDAARREALIERLEERLQKRGVKGLLTRFGFGRFLRIRGPVVVCFLAFLVRTALERRLFEDGNLQTSFASRSVSFQATGVNGSCSRGSRGRGSGTRPRLSTLTGTCPRSGARASRRLHRSRRRSAQACSPTPWPRRSAWYSGRTTAGPPLGRRSPGRPRSGRWRRWFAPHRTVVPARGRNGSGTCPR